MAFAAKAGITDFADKVAALKVNKLDMLHELRFLCVMLSAVVALDDCRIMDSLVRSQACSRFKGLVANLYA
jgi:uncharacterized protein YrrD